MKAAIQAVFAALFVVGGPFLLFFGPRGVLRLFEIPTHYAPDLSVMQQDLTALASLIIGLLLLSNFWATEPQLRAPFWAMTGAGLLGTWILFMLVY